MAVRGTVPGALPTVLKATFKRLARMTFWIAMIIATSGWLYLIYKVSAAAIVAL